MNDLHLRDEGATRELGGLVASFIEPGDVILLTGELGAGKTTFAKGFVQKLGGTKPVTSPTFTLCHLYDCDPVVAHLDCWRLSDVEEVIDLGIEEVLDEGGVALIEWGDVARDVLGRDALVVSLVVDGLSSQLEGDGEDHDTRSASLRATGESWARRLAGLHASLEGAGLKATGADAAR